MEKLRDKTFYTIFFIISSFIFIVIIFLNVQNYQKEYVGIENNLRRMNEVVDNVPKLDDKRPESMKDRSFDDLNNRIIMDYNFYTILLDDENNIIDKISHNENSFSDEMMEYATDIISNSDGSEIEINCLYFSKVAYNLKLGEFLIIVDTSSVQKRLLTVLFVSIVLLSVSFVLVYYFSKKITNWITEPVKVSFNKQKEFIANASHELKMPLSVIMASVDCLEVDKKNEKWLNNLKTESDRMNNLITRLLDLSRSESVLDKDTYVFYNLSKIVEKRTLTFESLAYEKQLDIESNIEKDIMFKCSQSDMDELVGVIIDNAIKHSFSGSTIMVNLYREKNNNIVLDIINNGEEIPKDECDKIFERFYRRDKSRNRNSNRYGLGLAIAKNIVINHNGEIKAFSSDNYTTFRVIFKNKGHF